MTVGRWIREAILADDEARKCRSGGSGRGLVSRGGRFRHVEQQQRAAIRSRPRRKTARLSRSRWTRSARSGLWRSTFGAVKIDADNAHGGLAGRRGPRRVGVLAAGPRRHRLLLRHAARQRPSLQVAGARRTRRSPARASWCSSRRAASTHGRWWSDRKDRVGDWNGWRQAQGAGLGEQHDSNAAISAAAAAAAARLSAARLSAARLSAAGRTRRASRLRSRVIRSSRDYPQPQGYPQTPPQQPTPQQQQQQPPTYY